MSVTPAQSNTARTGPPAMMPVPDVAGFSNTRPAPFAPTISCGMVLPSRGTWSIARRAASTAFRTASETSFAFPVATPTLPSPSPTATRALNENRRPPFTTFATRLMAMTFSLSSDSRSRRSRRGPRSLSAIALELQSAFARAVRHRLDASVIVIPGAVEHDPSDAERFGLLRRELAHRQRGAHFSRFLPDQSLGQVAHADQSPVLVVVHDLRVDVLERAKHHQPGPLRVAVDLLSDPKMPAVPPLGAPLRLMDRPH